MGDTLAPNVTKVIGSRDKNHRACIGGSNPEEKEAGSVREAGKGQSGEGRQEQITQHCVPFSIEKE